MTNDDLAVYAEKNKVGWIFLNDPSRLNPINTEMLHAVRKCLELAEENQDIRVVAIRGKGVDFSAGGDLAALSKMRAQEFLDFHLEMNRTAKAMNSLSKPVVACLHGRSLGGGAELSLSADIRVAEKGCSIGFPELKLGLNAGAGANALLPGLIGRGRALLLTFTSETVDADTAVEMGLVDACVEKDGLESWVRGFAEKVSSIPAASVAALKKAVWTGTGVVDSFALDYEAAIFGCLGSSAEVHERIERFLSKGRR
ncbi:MAG: enoyl-CoA hydratase/isomerase family protein [Thermoprotei archaeon]